MRLRKYRNYSYADFDQYLVLRPNIKLLAVMLYLSKNISLPLIAFAFGRGVDGHMSYILEGNKHLHLFLIASIPALLVIITWSRRMPNAGWLTRFIWNWGRWFLITSAILDGLLILALDRSFNKDLELIYLVSDGSVLAFLLLAKRVRDVFDDFPDPDLPSTKPIPVKRFSTQIGNPIHEASRIAEQMAKNNISREISDFLCEIKTKEQVHAEDWSALAIRSIEDGELEDAVTFFKAASHVEPENHVYPRNLCETFRRLGLYEAAVKSGLNAVNIAPADPISHFNLALAQSQNGQTELALMSYRQALNINPTYMEAWNNMGILLKSINKQEESEQAIQRSISIQSLRTK